MSLPTRTVHGSASGALRDTTFTWRARLPVHYPRPAVLSATLPSSTTDLDESSSPRTQRFSLCKRCDDSSVHRGLTRHGAMAYLSLTLLKSHLGCPTDTGLMINFSCFPFDRYHRYKWLLYNPTYPGRFCSFLHLLCFAFI